jgi:hypothetical protein
MDYEKFYEEHIPKSCLPSDFGGDLESVEVLHENHCKEFKRLRDYYVEEEQQAALLLDHCDKKTIQAELIKESERSLRGMTLSD